MKPYFAVFVLGFLLLVSAGADTAATLGKSPDTLSVYVKPYSVQVFSAAGKVVKPKGRVSIAVKVKDAQKKPVSNLSIRFSLELAPMEANGTELSSSEAVTDAKGEAKVTLVVGDREGTYRVGFASEESGVSSFFSVKAQSLTKSAATNLSFSNFGFPQNDISAIPPLPSLETHDTNETIVEIKPLFSKTANQTLPLTKKEPEAVKKEVKIEVKQPIFKKPYDEILLAEARVKLKLKALPGGAAKIVVKPSSVKVPADGKTQTLIAARILDAYGNPVADGTKITVQASKGKVVLQDEDAQMQGIQTVTKAGEVQFALTSPDESGKCYVQAKINDVMGEAQIRYYGTLSYMTLSPLSPKITCGSGMVFQASGFDKSDEPVTVAPVVFHVEGNIGSIDSKTGKFVATKTGTGKIIASAGNFKGFTDIEVLSAAPQKITAYFEPKAPSVNQNVTLVAKVFDMFGNAVPDVDVKFILTQGTGKLSSQNAKTSSDGLALTTLLLDKKVLTYKVVASHGAVQKSMSFKSLPGEIVSLKVLPKNIEVRAGVPLTFKAQGLDDFGNAVLVHPEFYALGIGKVDKDKGVFVSHKAGTGRVLVSVKQISSTSDVTVLPSKPVRIDVRSKQSQVTVGGETQIIATVYDIFGNTVPNVKLYFNVLSKGAKLSVIEHVTDSNGKAEATLKVPTKVSDVVIEVVSPEVNSYLPFSDEKQKGVTVLAQSGLFDAFPYGFPMSALLVASTGASLKIKIVSGEPQKILMKAFPAKITADGKSTSVVSVDVVDEYGNAVEKETLVTFKASAGKIATQDQDKNVSGTQVVLKGGKAQITLVSAQKVTDTVVSANVFELEQKVVISFIPSSVSGLKVFSDIQQLMADGLSTSKITVKVTDNFGNGVTDKNVVVSVDRGVLKIQPEQSPSKRISVSVVNGEGVCYFIAPKALGVAIVRAELGSLKSQSKIAIVAGALEQLQVMPGDKEIKAGVPVVFKAQGLDVYGNVISVSALWGVVGDGTVDESGRFVSLKPGKATVLARVGDIVGQSVVTITPAAPEKLKVTPSLSEAAAGQTVDITAYLYDKLGNAVQGETLFYQLVSQEGQLSSQQSVTDKNGLAAVSLTLSPHTGLNIVKVKHQNKNVRAVQVFIKGLPGPAASLTLRSSPPALSSAGYSLISAQVMDASGNLAEDGTSVTFTASSGLFSTGSRQLTVPVIGGMATTKLLFDSSDNEIVVTALAEGVSPLQLTLKRSQEPVVSITAKNEKKPYNGKFPDIPQLPPLTTNETGTLVVKSKMPHFVQSIQCSGCDVRWLLTELSKKSGVNIAADGSVKGETTINLQNISVEEALALIVRATGFLYEKVGDSYLVSTAEKLNTLPQTEIIPLKEAQAKDVETILKDIVKDVNMKVDKRTNSLVITAPRNQLFEMKRIISDLDEPAPSSAGIVVEVIRLQYADSDIIRTILEGMNIGKEEGAEIDIYNPSSTGGTTGTGTGGTTSTAGTGTTGTTTGTTGTTGGVSTGSSTSSAPGNIIVLKDTPYNIARAKAIIKGIDIQPKQVMIEARLEEINTDALKNIGFEWPAQLSTKFQEKGQDLKSFTRNALSITAVLNALHSSDDAKTLSSPSIATVDGKTAFIFIGTTKYYNQPTVVEEKTPAGGSTTKTIDNWKSTAIGITLNISPRVTDDNYISINLYNTVSTPLPSLSNSPTNIRQRTAQTFVRVKEGETITIGGLISNDEIEALSKVPLLADLPVLGSLFKNRSKINSQTELVIFLTPYIMK